MIFLKIVNDKVQAFADKKALETLTGSFFCDMVITPEEWAKSSFSAHVVAGKIVLGKSLELVKTEKLSEIKQAFNQEQESGHTTSSLGFEVDATRRSKDDIESLLYVGEFPVRFRDYNNEFHNLEKEQVEVLKREIIAYGLSTYQKKWDLEEAVKNAETQEEVENIKW